MRDNLKFWQMVHPLQKSGLYNLKYFSAALNARNPKFFLLFPGPAAVGIKYQSLMQGKLSS
ncbi:hypothetical cytosolic protein [Syntrophus aciditrophicus SB]|uniref:Hypothetical cytosolic protein n=1 Tax=Syntrophus aciditrophicus (strain SB) TaxID=56780 RepID=Q2LVA4_SYNAS|nr:hypothetical cytosolic protein [Syntrophus aciditrophicus SB]